MPPEPVNDDWAIATQGLTRSFARSAPPSAGWRRHLPWRGEPGSATTPPPEQTTFVAVHPTTLTIGHGERVAFIGPNGAGKSTTIKMLTGILHPTGGQATVLGHVPWRDRGRLGFGIATVFGQKSQLWYHLPARSTFELLRRVYDLDVAVTQRRIGDLTERFGLGDLLDRPVRTLSLGERMRCELAASLIHTPRLIFLDEPTIGLDIVARQAVRDHIRELNTRDGVTVFLTSHDAADIEQVCTRVIVVQAGRVAFDGPVATLRSEFVRARQIDVDLASPTAPPSILPAGVTLIVRDRNRWRVEVDGVLATVPPVVSWLMDQAMVVDLTIADPPMETVIAEIYRRGIA